MPRVAVLLGVGLLGENLTIGMVAGLILIALGAWLATGRRQASAEAEESPTVATPPEQRHGSPPQAGPTARAATAASTPSRPPVGCRRPKIPQLDHDLAQAGRVLTRKYLALSAEISRFLVLAPGCTST
jgi:hypothetical protein